MPSVSQKRRRSAPSSLAAWPKRTRNSRSAREASSAFTDTYRSCCLAKATHSRIWSSTHCRDFCSLCSMWMSLADMLMATASTPQSREWLDVVRNGAVPGQHRGVQAQVHDLRMVAFSSPPMAGMPTSIWCTPTSSSILAMRIFSWLLKTTPAVCSPSRSVVSSMRTAGSAGRGRCDDEAGKVVASWSPASCPVAATRTPGRRHQPVEGRSLWTDQPGDGSLASPRRGCDVWPHCFHSARVRRANGRRPVQPSAAPGAAARSRASGWRGRPWPS